MFVVRLGLNGRLRGGFRHLSCPNTTREGRKVAAARGETWSALSLLPPPDVVPASGDG